MLNRQNSLRAVQGLAAAASALATSGSQPLQPPPSLHRVMWGTGMSEGQETEVARATEASGLQQLIYMGRQ